MSMPPTPPRCFQCGSPAIVSYQTGFRLCVHCATAYDALQQAQFDRAARLAESLEDDMADIWGLPRPERRAVPARVNVNQINIHGDNHGVVNTGQISALTNNVRVINQHDPALAQSFMRLVNDIIASRDLVDAQKADALDLLRTLSEDAGNPTARRQPKATMKAIGGALQAIRANSANLSTIWRAIASTLGL